MKRKNIAAIAAVVLVAMLTVVSFAFNVVVYAQDGVGRDRIVQKTGMEFTRGFSVCFSMAEQDRLAISFIIDDTDAGVNFMFESVANNSTVSIEVIDCAGMAVVLPECNVFIESTEIYIDFFYDGGAFIAKINNQRLSFTDAQNTVIEFTDKPQTMATLTVLGDASLTTLYSIGEYSSNTIQSAPSAHMTLLQESEGVYSLRETVAGGIDAYVAAPFDANETISLRLRFDDTYDYSDNWLALIVNDKRGFVQPINAGTLFSRLLCLKGIPGEVGSALYGNHFIKGKAQGDKTIPLTAEYLVEVAVTDESFALSLNGMLQFETSALTRADFPNGVFFAFKSSSTAQAFAQAPINACVDFNRSVKIEDIVFERDSADEVRVPVMGDGSNIVLYEQSASGWALADDASYSYANAILSLDVSLLTADSPDKTTRFLVHVDGVAETFSVTLEENSKVIEKVYAYNLKTGGDLLLQIKTYEPIKGIFVDGMAVDYAEQSGTISILQESLMILANGLHVAQIECVDTVLEIDIYVVDIGAPIVGQTELTFDKKDVRDVTVDVDLHGAPLRALVYGETTILPAYYTLSEGKLIVRGGYLCELECGTAEFVLVTDWHRIPLTVLINDTRAPVFAKTSLTIDSGHTDVLVFEFYSYGAAATVYLNDVRLSTEQYEIKDSRLLLSEQTVSFLKSGENVLRVQTENGNCSVTVMVESAQEAVPKQDGWYLSIGLGAGGTILVMALIAAFVIARKSKKDA